MDGEHNGKPYENWWFGGTIIFGNTHIHKQHAFTPLHTPACTPSTKIYCTNLWNEKPETTQLPEPRNGCNPFPTFLGIFLAQESWFVSARDSFVNQPRGRGRFVEHNPLDGRKDFWRHFGCQAIFVKMRTTFFKHAMKQQVLLFVCLFVCLFVRSFVRLFVYCLFVFFLNIFAVSVIFWGGWGKIMTYMKNGCITISIHPSMHLKNGWL